MITPKKLPFTKYILIFLSFLFVNMGCRKEVQTDPNTNSDPNIAFAPGTGMAFSDAGGGRDFTVVNLVSDVHKYHPQFIDPNLVNAWGVAFGPTGGIWVSAADKGLSTIYNKNGNTLRPPVSIPFETDPNGGAPTGQVFNETSGFVIPSTGQVSKFIFATENGTIAAWASGNSAITVANSSESGTVYKGLTMGMYMDSWFLFATDFHNGHIDVYDQGFHNITHKFATFRDPNIPAGYAPFNIRAFGSMLIVTYAKQLGPDNEDDEAGAGNGYVDIFGTDGYLIHRLASRGTLNSPWGIEIMQTAPLLKKSGGQPDIKLSKILIGNFGDGRINVYDFEGKFRGQLYNHGKAVEIEGLWTLSYPPAEAAYDDVRSRLYFTAGPDEESHGIFGYITSQ
jgi:uncharacterized protein (TIGR03118 family)